MRNAYLAISTLIGAANLGIQAHAGTFDFTFAGSGVSGSAQLTYIVNPNTGILPDTSPNPVDPIGSYIVTGSTGSFSDTNVSPGVDSAITGVILSSPADPDSTNLLAPHSFGFYPGPRGVGPSLSYDDLFYPGGSPQTATEYPFSGGYFDIYGLIFTLANGDVVNFWSNGDQGGGVTYGAALVEGSATVDYVGGVSVAVPEPATWAVMLLGMGLVGAATRKRLGARSAV